MAKNDPRFQGAGEPPPGGQPDIPEAGELQSGDGTGDTASGERTALRAVHLVQSNVPTIHDQPTMRVAAVTNTTRITPVAENTISAASPTDAAATATPVISVRNLVKTYAMGRTKVRALRGVSLDVYPGEFVAVMGPSGSGKSTFMNLIGCLDSPTQGEYRLAGQLVSRLSSDELANIRNRLLGFVFQGFNLLSRASALTNVALPLVYTGLSREEREHRARKLLQLVGLGKRIYHKPSQLSGGQQQRVAVARALVNGPSVLLADEPTGNLDSRTSIEIMAILQALNAQGLTIVLVTHEADIAAYAKRRVVFRDGLLVRDEPNPAPRSARAEWEAVMKAPSEEEKPLIEEES